jgi:hypothetical protein
LLFLRNILLQSCCAHGSFASRRATGVAQRISNRKAREGPGSNDDPIPRRQVAGLVTKKLKIYLQNV